jgi:hypothetical protein
MCVLVCTLKIISPCNSDLLLGSLLHNINRCLTLAYVTSCHLCNLRLSKNYKDSNPSLPPLPSTTPWCAVSCINPALPAAAHTLPCPNSSTISAFDSSRQGQRRQDDSRSRPFRAHHYSLHSYHRPRCHARAKERSQHDKGERPRHSLCALG